MTKRDVCIIGVDDYTQRVATHLVKAGLKVVFVDKDQEKVDELSTNYQYVYKADATNKLVLDDMNISDFDLVIVGVSSMEESILIIDNLQSLNVKNVIARVENEVQKRILSILTNENIKIIWPEETLAEITSFRILHDIDINISIWDKDISITKLTVSNPKLFNIEIQDFELKNDFLTNIIFINRGDALIFPVRSNTKLLEGDIVTFACKSNTVNKVIALFTNPK